MNAVEDRSTPSIGLYSTLTSTGSRQLVDTIASACRDGTVAGVEVAFLFCNREEGEFDTTDESIRLFEAKYGFPIVRASAIRCRTQMRKAARASAAEGDEGPLWAWRDAFYDTYRSRLPGTDLDLLLGDMWIWGRNQCEERRGVNLHPSLPSGPLGKMWFDVVWDLVASDAEMSGVMLHRVTPEVDMGPVVAFCRYGLRGGELDALWGTLPECVDERVALIASQRALKREATHPLFHALRAKGLAREVPLMIETVRAVADGRLGLERGGVSDASGTSLIGGIDLTDEVERSVAAATSLPTST